MFAPLSGNARIREIARAPTDPGVARLKLDWWRSELARLATGEDGLRHPLMMALHAAGLNADARPLLLDIVHD